MWCIDALLSHNSNLFHIEQTTTKVNQATIDIDNYRFSINLFGRYCFRSSHSNFCCISEEES